MNKPQVTNALLVGVANYQTGPTGQEIDLNGTVWDAKAVFNKAIEKELQDINDKFRSVKRKVKTGRVRKGKGTAPYIKELHDHEATADNIKAELVKLCKNIEPGKAGMFYRSGHGTVITKAYEDDGTDEAFCAYDALYGGYVIDDEIAGIIAQHLHPDALLYIIADTCHSGDSHRAPNLVQTRGMLATNESIELFHKERKKTFVYSDALPKNVVGLYACASDQYSYEEINEYTGKVRGVYTLYLERFIPSIIDGTVDLETLHIEVSKLVAMHDTDNRIQTPQLEMYA